MTGTGGAFDRFLRPNEIVNYSEDSEAVAMARRLTRFAGSDTGKVLSIKQFIKNRLRYDKARAALIKSGELRSYRPDIDAVLRSGAGICFDYAVLFAAMLRAVGIPAKLVLGHIACGQYHAWNEVWDERAVEFVRMDVTFEDSAGWFGYRKIMAYIATHKNYKTKYEY